MIIIGSGTIIITYSVYVYVCAYVSKTSICLAFHIKLRPWMATLTSSAAKRRVVRDWP